MNKIICPVDFSSASLNSIEFAAQIGARHQATLTLFHAFTAEEFDEIIADSDLARRFPTETIGNASGRAEALIKSLAEEVTRLSGPQGLAGCDYYFSDGPLEQQMVTYADRNGYELVVMGTDGVKDIYEQFRGSHTAKTVDRASCPVLCVPENVSYQRLEKVMYATDYQDEDVAILQQVIAMVAPFGAQIEITHIVHDRESLDETTHHDYVERTRSALDYDNIHFSQKVYEEDDLHGIDHFAIEQDADLVVLMRKHHTFLERLFENESTERLSYFATYPVMVFQEEA